MEMQVSGGKGCKAICSPSCFVFLFSKDWFFFVTLPLGSYFEQCAQKNKIKAMIVEFQFENFRSFRDLQTFTMEATATKVKEQNTFKVKCGGEEELQLLKSAVIYGANASGKSNFILALGAFRWFITTQRIEAGKEIPCYEPYELGDGYDQKPTTFEITFIINHIKYNYHISFGRNEVYRERLEFFPQNRKAVLFERDYVNADLHTVKLGKLLKNKRIGKTTFNNQLYLSRFGREEPHEQLTEVWRYFSKLEINTGMDRVKIQSLSSRIAGEISKPNNERLAIMVNWLMKKIDNHIEKVQISSRNEDEIEFPDEIPEEVKSLIREQHSKKATSTHRYWSNGKVVGEREFEMLKKESTGTNIAFALGGVIMQTLLRGGVLIVDEFNSYLHPQISSFLIGLFHNQEMNPLNAQIVFNTHEVTLLENSFRSDQIWFVQKNEQGDSELYSAQDFKEVREDIPFEKWYLAGKFAAIPTVISNDYSGLNGTQN